jgi:hypothetical protein
MKGLATIRSILTTGLSTATLGSAPPTGFTGNPKFGQSSGTVNGNLYFAGAENSAYPGSGTFNGSVFANSSLVTSALATVNALSSTLGGRAGTALTVDINNNESQTINAGDGTLDVDGNRIFTVSSFNFNGGSTLTISGSTSDFVVFNFAADAQFKGTILLTGGPGPVQLQGRCKPYWRRYAAS